MTKEEAQFINKLCETFPPEIRELLYTEDENWFENKNQLLDYLFLYLNTHLKIYLLFIILD
jgi:hypothetical protein